ncbi:hypothetical protein MCOR29_011573 [Pyricularia oryzae]|nr:hypothetical protein MCOR29_011573 [Pyricularia oryzae]
MTRPRVPDDKRLRIAQACGFCKTRKQKCDGKVPCSLCIRKKNADNCVYNPAHRRNAGIASKRQRVEEDASLTTPVFPTTKSESPKSPCLDADTPVSTTTIPTPSSAHNGFGSNFGYSPEAYVVSTPNKDPIQSRPSSNTSQQVDWGAPVDESWSNQLLEGVNSWRDVRIPSHLYATERMLGLPLPEDLLGCSSHLAYLDALRNVLEVTGMPNPLHRPFDARFRLMELPPTFKQPSVTLPVPLPPERQLYHLVEAFLVNTQGLIQVFDEEATLNLTALKIISDGNQDAKGRVLLYLAVAIGIVIAGPTTESYGLELDAEAYFQSVETLVGTLTKDLWAVRVLLLKAMYSLAVVRRNEGYEHLGRAGLLAQQLGMHREEQILMRYDEIMKNGRPWSFDVNIGRLRRNVWRSLLLLDRFVAAQLGRPPVVADVFAFPAPPEDADGDITSLGPSIRGVEMLSTILLGIYNKSETLAVEAAEIAGQDIDWPYMNDKSAILFPSSQSPPTTPAELQRCAIHNLHHRLLQLHSVILLGRPFMLFDAHIKGYDTHPLSGEGEKFPRDAIEASYKSIAMVWSAMEEGFLSRRNPFIVYCMNSAILIVLSQEISSKTWKRSADPILRGDGQVTAMQKSIAVLEYMSEREPQSKHMLGIFRYLCSKCKNPQLASLAHGHALPPTPEVLDSPVESVGSLPCRTQYVSPSNHDQGTSVFSEGIKAGLECSLQISGSLTG